jgi:hypothetical protein
MGEEKDRRVLTDRRRKPTPRWSWYTFFGRRTTFRRKSDQEKGGYRGFLLVRRVILAIGLVYIVIVSYHMYLISYR